jgi:large subunit ribosomal protein L29
MASSVKAHELDEMNSTDLEARLREAKEELFNLRFQAATGQLESHGRLRTVKKDIARIYTVVRERELGIRSDPDTGAADTSDDTTGDTANDTEALEEGADA